MSPFRTLILEADRLGVQKLVWTCDVARYREDDEVERWTCVASAGLEARGAKGRSGEEALRRVVERVRKAELWR